MIPFLGGDFKYNKNKTSRAVLFLSPKETEAILFLSEQLTEKPINVIKEVLINGIGELLSDMVKTKREEENANGVQPQTQS